MVALIMDSRILARVKVEEPLIETHTMERGYKWRNSNDSDSCTWKHISVIILIQPMFQNIKTYNLRYIHRYYIVFVAKVTKLVNIKIQNKSEWILSKQKGYQLD